MASASSQTVDDELEQTAWDLEGLVEGEGREGVESRLAQALERARAFAERFAGRCRSSTARASRRRCTSSQRSTTSPAAPATTRRCASRPTPPTPAAARCCSACRSRRQRSRRSCCSSSSVGCARRRARGGAARRRRASTSAPIICAASPLPRHLLSEPEEKILAEKASPARRLDAPLRGAHLRDRGRAPAARARRETVAWTSRSAACRCPTASFGATPREASRAALAPGLRTRAFLFNTLLADKATDDRLRRYPHWLAARNLSNEASDESVSALIEAVRGRYGIARCWYRLKARLLGVEQLADYDRMAAVSEDEVRYPFAQAREIVLDCYSSFSPELGALVHRFFEERHIDAPVRQASAAARSAQPLCRRSTPT